MPPPDPNYRPAAPEKSTKPGSLYRGHTFTLSLLDGWQDKTIYTLTGPVENGIQHNAIINVDNDLPFDNVRDYADAQITALEEQLKGCRLLKRAAVKLANGMPAIQAVFSWYPTDKLHVYQEQIFVLVNQTGYKLTATFTKKTRKTLGPQVERMMLSFAPETIQTKSQ